MSEGSSDSDAALAEFCRREHPRLVGALSLYCGDPAVAEELAQEALIRAADRWPQVGQMAAPGAWLHRVAMNLCRSWFRRKRAERRANARVAGERAMPLLASDCDAVVIREEVARLPPRQRQAVVLRYYLDLSVQDTADALGLSPTAASSLTHRAISRLREQMLPAPEEARDV